MNGMHWPALITLLTIALQMWTAMLVARARHRHGVVAPATTGHPLFERAFRVQMNTLEGAVAFLPALWLCAWYLGALVGAGLGAAWLIGRVWFALAYLRDPAQRGRGFTLSMTALMALVAGAALGVARALAGVQPG